ncbi:MAG: hypothetical protein NW220_01195 [Leptolyngbyaceae cyanobacterium bins.349]|nr:hypothetical protein [Leptolyngbyaceae cyanobacterium bins.349]
MSLRSTSLSFLTIAVSLSAIASVSAPLAQAQPAPKDPPLPPLPKNCRLLPLVGGEGGEVTKTASPPGFRVPLPGAAPSVGVRNNWNTDWFVPSGQIFRTFRVVFMPRETTEYSVNATFKYPDDSIDQFYRERGRQFTANTPLIIEEPARSDLQPFQVNTNIGGLRSIGARYTVAVAGCL